MIAYRHPAGKGKDVTTDGIRVKAGRRNLILTMFAAAALLACQPVRQGRYSALGAYCSGTNIRYRIVSRYHSRAASAQSSAGTRANTIHKGRRGALLLQ
jgi:hypothetical protein